MILGVFILMAVSGFAQTREDGDRILKENGLNIIPKEYWALRMSMGGDKFADSLENIGSNVHHDMAGGIGRCKTIFNTPNGIYITTMEWISKYHTFRPATYLYTDFNTNFENGKLIKLIEGFGVKSYYPNENKFEVYSVIYSIDYYGKPDTGYTVKVYDLSSNKLK